MTAGPTVSAKAKAPSACDRLIARLEEKNAELQASEARFRTLTEATSQLVWRGESGGAAIGDSPGWREFTGQAPAEMLGQGWATAVHPDDRREVRRAWVAAVAMGTIFQAECRVRRHDGEYRDFLLRGVPLRDAAGSITEWVGTCRDITERRQAQRDLTQMNAELERRVARRTAALEEANHELERFAYSISHDLRAPLRAIDNFSAHLLEDHAGQLDAEGQRLLGVIRRNAARMGQLICDILEFSRAGRADNTLTHVDVGALAREVFTELQAAHPSPARLEVAELPAAWGDRAAIRQVLANLVGNAVKFSRGSAAPVVRLEGRVERGQTVYAVSDNGAGFDPRYAHKLFSVFERLHAAEEFEGTGIGLAIVKRLVDRHGGEVQARVNDPEPGAAFIFTLPLPLPPSVPAGTAP